MTDYVNLDVLLITVYIITLVICLGVIAAVVWGWRKRMRYTTPDLKRLPE
jgi:hypothetical protein